MAPPPRVGTAVFVVLNVLGQAEERGFNCTNPRFVSISCDHAATVTVRMRSAQGGGVRAARVSV